MKARRSTAPVKISPTHQRALEITQHKKMLKMKVALDESLKTKGQKSAPDDFMKINELSYFPDDIMISKELAKILVPC